jgi:hypothetical protein
MRCFYVLVHGSLEWKNGCAEDEELFTPAGFYCHRYVVASGYKEAAEKAFHRIRKNLEKQTGWLKQGLVRLTLEAEELSPAPFRKLLRRTDKGHAFYGPEPSSAADGE